MFAEATNKISRSPARSNEIIVSVLDPIVEVRTLILFVILMLIVSGLDMNSIPFLLSANH